MKNIWESEIEFKVNYKKRFKLIWPSEETEWHFKINSLQSRPAYRQKNRMIKLPHLNSKTDSGGC